MADLNKLRQTKEYQGTPRFTTKEHLNEVHNKLWGEDYYKPDPVKQVMAQQIDEEMKECPLDPVEEAKILIVDKITTHFQDVMFEMICEEMDDNKLFQSSNYLTEAGYDVFEDEWFEFYHEHHGDILHQVMKNITN